MLAFIQKHASWKNVLILLGIMLCFYFLFFPVFLPKGEHALLLDSELGYRGGEVYEIIGNYSDSMRRTYVLNELTLDLVFPFVYTFLFAFVICLLYRRPFPALIPFLALAADLLENAGLVILMSAWPKQLLWLAITTSRISGLKWALAGTNLVIVAAGAVYFLITRKKI